MTNKEDSEEQGILTTAVHAGEVHDALGAHINPIYQTSTFVHESVDALESWGRGEREAYTYSRGDNPTRQVLAQKIAALEAYGMDNAEAVTAMIFSSGMGAISGAILGMAKAGDHIIAQQVLYGSSHHLLNEHLPKYNITSSRVPLLEAEALKAELKRHPNTVAVYLETPANPTMTIIDIAETAKIAHAHGVKLIVDNTFASPILQQPLALGADVVVHSVTKFLNGHGTVIQGAIVSADAEYMENGPGQMVRYLNGAAPSAFDCWLTNIGLKTLPLRMRQHCLNAKVVAEFLDGHAKVPITYWPGLASHPNHDVAARQMSDFGPMMSIDLGSYEAAGQFMDGLSLCSLGVSLGNVDTLVQHPASMTHRVVPDEDRAAAGITPGMVRISVGIEDAADIVADLARGLDNIA